jgi:hypothetical protein
MNYVNWFHNIKICQAIPYLAMQFPSGEKTKNYGKASSKKEIIPSSTI